MKTKQIKFIVDPQDELSLNMDKIRGGIADESEVGIDCHTGRVKCKNNGNIKGEEVDMLYLL